MLRNFRNYDGRFVCEREADGQVNWTQKATHMKSDAECDAGLHTELAQVDNVEQQFFGDDLLRAQDDAELLSVFG